MRILIVLAALFTLAGCESMDFTSVTVSSGYSHYYPTNHISYTLGYYSGSYYNGYRVYGSHGHRYYHAPRHYRGHRHFARPVVVQHVHVHTSYCEHTVRPRNNHRDRDNHRSSYVQPQVRNTPRTTPPRRTQPRATQPRQRENRANNNNQRENRVVNSERRENRQDRKRDPKRKRK